MENHEKVVIPDMNVPYEPEEPYMDLRDRALAACNTITEVGLDIEITKESKDEGAALATAYAESPEEASKKASNKKMATLTPASLAMAGSILNEFGQSVVESASTVRNLVTNKLILETENPDPRVRLKALELLGKISDIGLFSEKTEVKITHKSAEDVRNRLRSKLSKLADIQEAEIIETRPINVAKELGI